MYLFSIHHNKNSMWFKHFISKESCLLKRSPKVNLRSVLTKHFLDSNFCGYKLICFHTTNCFKVKHFTKCFILLKATVGFLPKVLIALKKGVGSQWTLFMKHAKLHSHMRTAPVGWQAPESCALSRRTITSASCSH